MGDDQRSTLLDLTHMAPEHDSADARIDAALEALARPTPPADHVARVLDRSGPASVPQEASDAAPRRLPVLQPAAYLTPRWVLPVAATLLVALGAFWQAGRIPLASPEATRWGAPREVIQPVLPPQAYWAMDPVQEFRTLRPDSGTQARRSAHQESGNAGQQGRKSAGSHSPSLTAGMTADDELAWTPVPSGLPDIELSSIVPAPLEVAPLEAPEAIALPEIALDPIVIAPLIEEEKP